MTVPTSTLWFSIEEAFSQIESACVEARAAELAARETGRATSSMALTAPPGPPPALPPTADPSAQVRQSKIAELARDMTFREAHPGGADLVSLRQILRKRLLTLRQELLRGLPEHEVYVALMPIVIYADELLASVSTSARGRWEPLQSEILGFDNGGEYFYTLLDERLTRQETHPLVLQIFYFCLRDGFVGMYDGDRVQRDAYLARLAERIPLAPVPPMPVERPPAAVRPVAFPWRYYAWAAAAVASGWALLAIVGALS